MLEMHLSLIIYTESITFLIVGWSHLIKNIFRFLRLWKPTLLLKRKYRRLMILCRTRFVPKSLEPIRLVFKSITIIIQINSLQFIRFLRRIWTDLLFFSFQVHWILAQRIPVLFFRQTTFSHQFSYFLLVLFLFLFYILINLIQSIIPNQIINMDNIIILNLSIDLLI